jgi:thiol-disulfide isomerase/thioredoxin
MNLSRFILAVLVTAALLGCGGPKPTSTAKADTTSAVNCTKCTGSDSIGAICDTTLDTTAASGAVVAPETQKSVRARKIEAEQPQPKSEPEKVAEKPKGLPKMWDFGSEKCIPCKTMLEILTPMMADYKGKVDIRIINVYEDKERTQQFRIVTIPTQVFIDAEGKELFRHVGVFPRDSIEAKFREFGFPVASGT